MGDVCETVEGVVEFEMAELSGLNSSDSKGDRGRIDGVGDREN